MKNIRPKDMSFIKTLKDVLAKGEYVPYLTFYPIGNPIDGKLKSIEETENEPIFIFEFHCYGTHTERIPLSQLNAKEKKLLLQRATTHNQGIFLYDERTGKLSTVITFSDFNRRYQYYKTEQNKLLTKGYQIEIELECEQITLFSKDNDNIWLFWYGHNYCQDEKLFGIPDIILPTDRIQKYFKPYIGNKPSMNVITMTTTHDKEKENIWTLSSKEEIATDIFIFLKRMYSFCKEQEILGRKLYCSNGYFYRSYEDIDSDIITKFDIV